MKLILASLLIVMSFSVFASLSEVECTGQAHDQPLFVQVDEGFPSGSFRRAMAQIDNFTRYFTVMSRGAFGNRVRYEGANFQLEVDFWPDQRPQWARTYRGTFASSEMNVPFTQVWCRFPNIRP